MPKHTNQLHNQNKEKQAAELVAANQELLLQSKEKEKRAAELVIANQELLLQSKEKEKRAAELVVANQELLFQSKEKEKRAAELVVANQELLFQSKEKEKRAAELVVANKELLFQNEEKEKRATELFDLLTELKDSREQLLAAYDSTIEGWSHALDLRDKETEGHTLRVTEMVLKLSHAAEITKKEMVHVQRGALLHDIGKMGVPDYILHKPDKLSDEEWVAMRKHPTFAFELLSPIEYLRPALDIPYCHHEKWDGSGYPRGLKGLQIPLVARLFAIVDVWDALLSDRPYRQSWSKEKVIEHIKSLSGTHFDPNVVELFFNMMSEDEKNAG
jgi:response regulator RpfG family c-di-GMP phosphodiesterase